MPISAERQALTTLDQLYATLVEVGSFAVDHVLQDAEKAGDFIFGPAPVLSREDVEGDDSNVICPAGFQDPSDVLCTKPVPYQARKVALLCPTSVPIHHNTNVSRAVLKAF